MSNLIFDIQRFITTSKGNVKNEQILNTISGNSIYTYGGKDSINNWKSNNFTINSGDEDDIITIAYGNNLIIYGGTGKNSIENNYGNKVIISSGSVADFISNFYDDSIEIDSCDDNDTLYNVSSNDVTMNGGSGTDWIENHCKITSKFTAAHIMIYL